jgi:gamma-glutamyl:cysteine ligase YbdK (ATP-grasp superfamily)
VGVDIDRERFTARERARFRDRLEGCLEALASLLERPGFGEGPTTIGAELELHLVDAAGRPSPVNQAVLATADDPELTPELDRFNLEINAPPLPLAGRPFSALARQLDDALATIRTAAAVHQARPALCGILPTLEDADLAPSAMTDLRRYRALSTALRQLHGVPFPLRIHGRDTLELAAPDVTFEGANASFQVHLRVAPRAFAAAYNAAQVAAAPALAIGCNSPFLLGRRLWAETRVALFRQAVDHRRDALVDDWRPARVSFGHGWVRTSAHELFAQSVALHEPLLPVLTHEDPAARVDAGEVPALGELRLHGSTVWQWNRAIYDPGAGGHLRIEFRALPSGPTVIDMAANAAFFLGLVLDLAPRIDPFVAGFVFGHARRNFYEAARRGLEAELLWPSRPGRAPVPRRAAELVAELTALARRGLESAGVAADEADAWLAVVRERTRAHMTGSRWQDRVAQAEQGQPRRAALAAMFARYLDESDAGRPVHEWSVAR